MFSLFKPLRRQPTAFISFDVEALLFRAPGNQVDTLIWGKTPQGEYGIRRICDILHEHKLRGNFLVDMAACTIYGDQPIREVCEYLLGEGHEVHAHLHPELLATPWGWKTVGLGARRMGEFDLRVSSAIFEHIRAKFLTITGKPPTLFRSGSYRFNRNTILAAQQAGILALSNYSAENHREVVGPDEVAQRMEPFCWSNGVAEIPVDISSPEKSHWFTFLKNCDAAFRKHHQTCNVVMHSWSLLRRNSEGHHLEFGPELEEQFHRICSHLRTVARVMGYDEYLEGNPPDTVVDLGKVVEVEPLEIKDARQCLGCGAILAPQVMVENNCVSCSSAKFIECDYRLPEDPVEALARSIREENKSRLNDAEQLLQEEKFAEALSMAEPLLESDLKVYALKLQGRVFARTNQPAQAEAVFRALLLETGGDAACLAALSSALLGQKKVEEAIEIALRAVECDPLRPGWRVKAADLLLRAKRFEEAEKIVTTGLLHSPDNPALMELKRRLEASRVSAQGSA